MKVDHPLKLSPEIHQKIAQGQLNQSTMTLHQNYHWPTWVDSQLNPESPEYQIHPFPFSLLNTSKRNETALRTPQCKYTSILSTEGMLTIEPTHWSIEIALKKNNQTTLLSKTKHITQTLLEDGIQTEYKEEKNTLQTHCSKIILDNKHEAVILKITLKNTNAKKETTTLALSIRPYNNEGLSPLWTLTYHPMGIVSINNKLGVLCESPAHNVLCTKGEEGDSLNYIHTWDHLYHTNCKKGLASASLLYTDTLQKNEEKTYTFTLLVPSTAPELNGKPGPGIQKLAQHTQIKQIPTENNTIFQFRSANAKLEHSLKNSITHVLNSENPHETHTLDIDTEALNNFFNRYCSLAELNKPNTTKALLKQIKLPNALFLRYKAVSAPMIGRYLYTLSKSHHPKDPKLMSYYLTLKRLAHNIRLSQKETPIKGILKKSIHPAYKEHHEFYVKDILFTIAGLVGLRQIAQKEELKEDAVPIRALINRLRHVLKEIQNHIENKYKFKILPLSTTTWASPHLIETLWIATTTKELSKNDPTLEETLSYTSNFCLKNQLVLSNNHPSGIAVVESFRLAQAYRYANNPKALDILETLLDYQTQTTTWPTAMHPHTYKGCEGAGHDINANIECIRLVQSCLVDEEAEDIIHLTPLIRSNWVTEEHSLTVENHKTKFGILSFSVRKSGNKLHYKISGQFRGPLPYIVISWPQKIHKVWIEENEYPHQETKVILPKNTNKVVIEIDE